MFDTQSEHTFRSLLLSEFKGSTCWWCKILRRQCFYLYLFEIKAIEIIFNQFTKLLENSLSLQYFFQEILLNSNHKNSHQSSQNIMIAKFQTSSFRNANSWNYFFRQFELSLRFELFFNLNMYSWNFQFASSAMNMSVCQPQAFWMACLEVTVGKNIKPAFFPCAQDWDCRHRDNPPWSWH